MSIGRHVVWYLYSPLSDGINTKMMIKTTMKTMVGHSNEDDNNVNLMPSW